MARVLVLGASGMLGLMLVDFLSKTPRLAVTGTVRNVALLDQFRCLYPSVNWAVFDYGERGAAFDSFDGQDWIINAIGITKPLIREDNPAQILAAIRINSLLPYEIGRAAEARGARVLQVATDCVYSGRTGHYTEDDAHDALDIYGKTKSLGETFLANTHHLRCSLIGPEPKDYKFLVEWFRRQPAGAAVNGFVNHQWNGMTTLHFAKICQGIIECAPPLGRLQHVVPAGTVSKARMLHDFAEAFARTDIRIHDIEATSVIDRTLATRCADSNVALWRAAGYEEPPTVPEMIRELGRYPYAPDAARL
jgi:dTDP-4-dehydrorhamnose reductase